jgi:hypothetical protein
VLGSRSNTLCKLQSQILSVVVYSCLGCAWFVLCFDAYLYVMTHIHCVIVLLWCFCMLIASIRMYFYLMCPVSMYLIDGMNKDWEWESSTVTTHRLVSIFFVNKGEDSYTLDIAQSSLWPTYFRSCLFILIQMLVMHMSLIGPHTSDSGLTIWASRLSAREKLVQLC